MTRRTVLIDGAWRLDVRRHAEPGLRQVTLRPRDGSGYGVACWSVERPLDPIALVREARRTLRLTPKRGTPQPCTC